MAIVISARLIAPLISERQDNWQSRVGLSRWISPKVDELEHVKPQENGPKETGRWRRERGYRLAVVKTV